MSRDHRHIEAMNSGVAMRKPAFLKVAEPIAAEVDTIEAAAEALQIERDRLDAMTSEILRLEKGNAVPIEPSAGAVAARNFVGDDLASGAQEGERLWLLHAARPRVAK